MNYYKNTNIKNLEVKIKGIKYSEKWKDIENYEGYYQVSSFGRIKAVPRYVKARNGKPRLLKERILVQQLGKTGYLSIGFSKENKIKRKYIHILVGEAFIPNPMSYPEINHKYGIKTDNQFWELEWTTHSGNGIHAYAIKLREAKKGSQNHFSKTNEKDVISMRKLYSTGKYLKKDIAKIYNLDARTVGSIIRKETWAHV